MGSQKIIPRDPLFDRVERVIADAVATRHTVREALGAAKQIAPYRPSPAAGPTLPACPAPLPWSLLEPWWSVARALSAAGIAIHEADAELERGWQRILPTIETPVASVAE